MSQALYRKYRSKSLSEIVGQEHITVTLENAIKNGKISHAYLFTGPRGVGKTSIARILAHQINKIPYDNDSGQLDIIEIDAASNRRIDEIRDLRDKVHISPTSAKYKVYIIDEVHMLTKEAFNALLKTLEEPPKHVVFILATTEIHKLPDTIISRTQRFTFKSIDDTKIVEHLGAIAKAEKIKIDEQALELLAKHGNGSFRDSISLLDQVSSSGFPISKHDVEQLIGVAPEEHIDNLLQSTIQGSPVNIINDLDKLISDGVNPNQIAKQLSSKLRSTAVANNLGRSELELISDLLNTSVSPEPISSLEISLLSANLKMNPVATTQTTPVKVPESTLKTPSETSVTKSTSVKPKQVQTREVPEEIPPETNQKTSVKNIAKIQIDDSSTDWWNEVLKYIKTNNNTLHGILRMANIQLDGQELNLIFKFAFHKKKLADPLTLAKLSEAIQSVTGQNLTIKPIHNQDDPDTQNTSTNITADVDNTPKKQINSDKALPEKQSQGNNLSTITNIFGGGEVLES